MSALQTIVVAVDFTPCSAVALRQALRIAESRQANVHVLHVVDTLVVMEFEEALTPLQYSIREGLIADARKAWAAFAADIPGAAGLPFDTAIDNRVRGIIHKSDELKADLIVMGAFGTRAPDVGLGTVATGCVRRAACDVLVVRDTQPGPFEKILAAIDFSENSVRTLEQAARLAADDDAELHILHVFDPPWDRLPYWSSTPQLPPPNLKAYRDGLDRKLHEFVRPVLDTLPKLRVCYSLFDDRRHRSAITAYAEKVGAQLVALGTRGRTNLRDVLLGSTAERTLVRSTCSVLAVRPAGHHEARA